jgi:hypothetical protein
MRTLNLTYLPAGPIHDEQTFGEYTVRTHELDEGSFEILKNNVLDGYFTMLSINRLNIGYLVRNEHFLTILV